MERILSYYVPNITFDIQSLRQAAEELKNKHRDSESDVLSMKADANDLEDLAIDEEDFTIKALPDNTTRMFAGRYNYQRAQTNFSDRILWGVLLPQFL
jgi:hypothetical protein